MDKMCWQCTELYDDSLVKCPFCGAPKDNPPPVKAPVVEKVPVKKPVVTKPKGRK